MLPIFVVLMSCPTLFVPHDAPVEVPRPGCVVLPVPVVVYPLELAAQVRNDGDALKMVESRYDLLKKDYDARGSLLGLDEAQMEEQKARSAKLTRELADLRQSRSMERVLWATGIVVGVVGGFLVGLEISK